MSNRSWVPSSALAIMIAAALSAPTLVAAQATSGAKTTEKTAAAKPAEKKPWTLGHTPDGQPDLQGYWTSLTFTPMERPAKFAGREFLTDEEMKQVFEEGVAHSVDITFNNPAETPVYDSTVYGLAAWQNGVQPNRRSSIVVDPPNGKIPPLTPEGAKRTAGLRRNANEEGNTGVVHADIPADLGVGVRCLSFGGPPIGPGGYDSTYHLVQAPGYVLIEYEWNSEARIIPLDGGPHVSSNMQAWHGDSRGHWEGNTLVVETTNFRGDNAYRGSNPKALKVTERFTRIGESTIEYKFTIDDPTTWTKPWSGIVPMTPSDGPMFEYACSEGNNGLINIMAGARATEKATKAKDAGTPISQK